jgi:tRNA dimethylallyltransferase
VSDAVIEGPAGSVPRAREDGPPRLVAILGPTASGKSDLGLALAERFGGEILCCDSMQVYRGMDVGTGKPSRAEQARIPHHLLDLVDPGEPFHAGRWADLARAAIVDVTGRGRLPVIVGGTGLYFRALVRGLFEAPPSDPEIRARHDAASAREGVPALHARLAAVDPEAAAGIRVNDLVRISRALEVWEQTGVPISELRRRAPPPPPLRVFTIVLDPSLDDLRERIDRRVDAMIAAGWPAEVERLWAGGFARARAMEALGYRQLGQVLEGTVPLDEAIAETKRITVAYARRQRTWFRKEDATLRLPLPVDPARVAGEVAGFLPALDPR